MNLMTNMNINVVSGRQYVETSYFQIFVNIISLQAVISGENHMSFTMY